VQAQRRGVGIDFIPIRGLDPVFDFYTPVLISSDQFLNSSPELAKAFLGAVSKGYKYTIEHPDEAAGILVKAEPSLDPDHVKLSLGYLKDQFQADASTWGFQQLEVWQRFTRWMLDQGIIKGPVKIQDLFTNEYLP
jgi:ABC-type nitrate/sulfonate/bicarbonate transport system substrate-binding protein